MLILIYVIFVNIFGNGFAVLRQNETKGEQNRVPSSHSNDCGFLCAILASCSSCQASTSSSAGLIRANNPANMEMNATNLLPYNANSSNPSMTMPSLSGSNWWWAPGQKAAEEAEAFRAAAAGQPTNEQMQQADNEQTVHFVATTVEAMLSQIPGISRDILASINLSQLIYCQNFAAMVGNLLLQNYDEKMPQKILNSLTLPNEYLQYFEKIYRLKLLNLEKLADKGQMGRYVLEKKLLNLRIFADFFLTLSNICKTKQNQNNALANREITWIKLANSNGFLEICFEQFYKQIAQAIIEQGDTENEVIGVI